LQIQQNKQKLKESKFSHAKQEETNNSSLALYPIYKILALVSYLMVSFLFCYW